MVRKADGPCRGAAIARSEGAQACSPGSERRRRGDPGEMAPESPKPRRGGGSFQASRRGNCRRPCRGLKHRGFAPFRGRRFALPSATCLSPFGAHDCNAWVNFAVREGISPLLDAYPSGRSGVDED